MAPAVAPAGAAHDGGSLMDTVTVPEAGLCMEAGPPPQLIIMKATAMTRDPSKSETGWPFSQSGAGASMVSLRSLSDEVVNLSAVRCGTECWGGATTLDFRRLRAISTETHRASTSMLSTGRPFPRVECCNLPTLF